MRIIHVHEGRLEIRWTWLPLWLASNPKLKSEVERQIRDACLVNGMTTSDNDLDALHRYTIKVLARTFPIPGLGHLLDALREVKEPA